MKHLSLATRYRPQTFAEVAGQPLAATALSRAAATDKVAPAYLLSGTRGVGKTTIARIFAKALNCEHGPGAEPCNECAQCRHITAGNHVDVNEIDAASNTGVEDVRALRETIGYLPMEGRYKIYIVDEAHMLSKSAFNALLKTLEEPPAHTVFIFATTEAHRFPATIISRCQHFVFRHLSEDAIFRHLLGILQKENVEFEENAIHLIARRAAGSARDSLSLLDQALAVSGGALSAESVRAALGVAGPELYDQLLDAIASKNLGGIMELAGGLLASGVDMGFFTRELGSMWRNLFLLRQAGDKIFPSLGNITEDEKIFLKKHASEFNAAHLHAAWQMTLESQRGIAQSPEPGASLELLLLNLALLPQLLPVGEVESRSTGGVSDTPPPSYAPEREAIPEPPAPEKAAPQSSMPGQPSWAGFCDFCAKEMAAGRAGISMHLLRPLQCSWFGDDLEIAIPGDSLANQIEKNIPLFEETLKKYLGGNLPRISWLKPRPAMTRDQLREACANDPGMILCKEILGAEIDSIEEKRAIIKG